MTVPSRAVDELALVVGPCLTEQLRSAGLSATEQRGSDTEPRSDAGDELIGIAGISGERGRGTLLLRTTAVVLERAHRPDEASARPDDRMAELTATVFEQVRRRCHERGLELDLSAPRVIAGTGLRATSSAGAASRLLEYVSEAGAIAIGVEFVARDDAALFDARQVLVVDDSAAVRQEVRALLEANGYRVVEASDGAEGLDLVLAHDDLAMVLCDVNMPAMDGIAFVEHVKGQARFAELPIVMLTSEVRVKVCGQALKVGAAGWLVKPFNPAQLLATVDKLARQRGDRTGLAPRDSVTVGVDHVRVS